MKKLISTTMVLSLMFFSLVNVFGQEERHPSEKTEQARQKAELAKQRMELELIKAEYEKVEAEAQVNVGQRSSSRSSSRSSYRSLPNVDVIHDEGVYVVSGEGSAGNNSFFYSTRSQGSSSSNLNLSKTYDGESKENSGSFQVDESVRHISLNINGNVNAGSITIKLFLSDGKVFKEVTLDDSANMSFNQTIRIAEDEEKYYGDWEYKIIAKKAEGRYQMMLQTH